MLWGNCLFSWLVLILVLLTIFMFRSGLLWSLCHSCSPQQFSSKKYKNSDTSQSLVSLPSYWLSYPFSLSFLSKCHKETGKIPLQCLPSLKMEWSYSQFFPISFLHWYFRAISFQFIKGSKIQQILGQSSQTVSDLVSQQPYTLFWESWGTVFMEAAKGMWTQTFSWKLSLNKRIQCCM